LQEAHEEVLARTKAHFARRKEEINAALLNAGEGGKPKSQRRRFFSQEVEQDEGEEEEEVSTVAI
jgi:hypothetical protein